MNIVFFGKPGSGKGTQAEILAKKLGLYHFSTGELFRKQMKEDTELGRKVKVAMDSPDLVLDEIANEVAAEEMKRRGYDGIMFDGYPRTLKQAEFFDKQIKVDFFLLLDVSDEAVIDRMQKRQEIDPRTETSSLEKVKKRMKVYEKLTSPVVEKYRKEGKLVVVKGEGSIEEIAKRVEKACQR
ncbi:MAG: nucleoside monophosphate kinase [Candidatus Woesearchaeota archaeon]